MQASGWRRSLAACLPVALAAALAPAAFAAAPTCDPNPDGQVAFGGQTTQIYLFNLCSDSDGEKPVHEIVAQPSVGSLSSVANGHYISVHFAAPTVSGPTETSFQVRAHDGTSSSAPVTVPVTILPASDASVHCAFSGGSTPGYTDTIYNNQPRDVGIRCHRGAVRLGVSLAGGPAHGTLTDAEFDGGRVYRPTPGYVGQDSISYSVAGESSPRTVGFDVQNPAAPRCTDDVDQTVAKDRPSHVWMTCQQRGGLRIMRTDIVEGPSVGSFSGLDTIYPIYTPPAGFTGDVTFRFRAVDDIGASETRNGVLRVSAPLGFSPNCYGTATQTRNTRPLAMYLQCTSGGDDLVTSIVDGPQRGTLSARDADADGYFVYTPEAGYTGVDSFTFRSSNASGTSSVQRMVIWVLPASQAEVNANSPLHCYGEVFRQWVPVNAVNHELWVDCFDSDNDSLTRQAIAPNPLGTVGGVGSHPGTLLYSAPRNTLGGDMFGSRMSEGVHSADVISRVWLHGEVTPPAPPANPGTGANPGTTPTIPQIAGRPAGRVLGSFGPISLFAPASGGALGVGSPGVDAAGRRGSFGTAYNGGATEATVTATGALRLDRRGRASASAKKKARTLRLAQVRQTLQPGQSRALTFKVGAKALKAIGKRKSVKVSVTVVVAPKGGKVVKTTKTMTLKVKAKKKKKKR